MAELFIEDDPKKVLPTEGKPVLQPVKTPVVKPAPYDFDTEMRGAYKKVIPFDNKPAIEVARSAATKAGINPSLLFSSAYQEGMNKSILDPDTVSEAFTNAEKKGLDTKTYPVDGFYNYGLDTFGDRYATLKKYLPEGFDKRFKVFGAKNEKNENIRTAAFMTNEDALIAKSAMLREAADNLAKFAKEKKITVAPEDLDYFTLAQYNGGPKNARHMLLEYAKAKDKRSYIDKGETSKKQVHGNISPRLQRMKLAQELFDEKPE